ncbi:MAG: TIGR01777 family oxidoreductase [Opitutaceae bacterium]|nr:TIGR01777 family oxidoreductase [Opitutaceae bacterium]
MAEFEKASTLACSAEDLFDWHARDGAFERLIPPWRSIQIVSRKGGIETGAEIETRLRQFGMYRDWIARIEDCEIGRGFRDTQVDGPFASWSHQHTFEEQGSDTCRLIDSIDYELPAGTLGRLVAGGYVKRELNRLFRYRHAITKSDLSVWSRYRSQPRLRILISGGYGFIGSRLTALLRAQGNEVRVLSRNPQEGDISWDPAMGSIDSAELEGFDVVMHLAGKNLADGRWSEQGKCELWKSRVDAGYLLVEALKRVRNPPRVFVCASGVGFYGESGESVASESTGRGEGFLAELCEAWEGVARAAEAFAERTLILRTGVVVDGVDGAMSRMLLPFSLGLGGRLGSGRQWMPWIALEDWVTATYQLIRGDGSGVYNLVAPEPCRNAGFTKALGTTLGRPTLLPVPAGALSLILGEFAREALLSSCRAHPQRLLDDGYRFKYPEIGEALSFCLGR